uniref:cytochrome c oxidase subunit II n=1 Tax=Gammarus nipponensis TaxID=353628 RepID=UPI00286CEF2C|nr:cytochrome c oxidase subunit II [Gammarus nipponensis]WLS55458.1 cytochrome c oxidase subunit II [Gammarus nipponensis]
MTPTWHMLSFQDSASPSMEHLTLFHDFTMAVMTTIMALVALILMFISMYKLTDRFFLQDQTTEIIWTISPVIILLAIALPSLQALYLLDDPLSPNISIKVMGHQWYWSYEYSDFKTIEFDSYMLPSNNTHMRLLDTDNSVAMPTLTQIRLLTTSADVIHSWSMPALAVKSDALPGRLNQLMIFIKRPGLFYGQCSEICGSNHSFMPIKIEALPMKTFLNWALSFN